MDKKVQLVIEHVTLRIPAAGVTLNDRNLTEGAAFDSGSADFDARRTEVLIQQIQKQIRQHSMLLLWLRVFVIVGDKGAVIKQWGGGIPLSGLGSFEYVLRRLEEIGAKLIGEDKDSGHFTTKELGSQPGGCAVGQLRLFE